MHPKLSLKQLAKACGGAILREGLSNDVSALAFDSRKLPEPDGTVFFALKSATNDGLRFLEDAYRKGVRTFVVPRNFFPDKRLSEGSFVEVEDTLLALQALATAHRRQFTLKVVGITGSNGKTIVKDWLSQLVGADQRVCKSPKSYNSQIGVPISVWELRAGDTLAIFEAGISQPGEMERLARIIQPTQGIFTNIGEAHGESFSDKTAKIWEKLRLFEQCEKLIYTADNSELTAEIKLFSEKHPRLRVISWSQQHPADYQISTSLSGKEALEIQVSGKKSGSFHIPFADKASLENAMHAWVWMVENGYDPKDIAPRFMTLPRIRMRMEMKAAINSSTLINDSYSLDLDSLGIALDYLDRLTHHKQKTVILSDFDQNAGEDEALFKRVATLLREHRIDRLVGVGTLMTRYKKQFTGIKTHFFERTNQAAAELGRLGFANEAILLKGARRFGFEQLEQQLALKQHQTVLEIDLDAMLHNYQFYRALLKPNTRMMVMVKAFSYGSGTFEVASLLQHHRADYLAVAYADEGVALREAGITLPIMVMNVEPAGLEKLVRYQLEPEVYSFRLLEELITYLQATETKGLAIHLNIDTGMKRLGFDCDEVMELGNLLKNQREVRVASVYSHLVASDASEHLAFTLDQISNFKKAADQLSENLGYKPLVHILNTAGIINFSEAQFDMVRLGIGLYGYDSAQHFQDKLQVVGTLKTVISQLRTVKASETIGYNRNGKTEHDSTIATLPIGYADGIGRMAGHGKMTVLVNGKEASTIGNICMDMLMVNVSGITCKEGDEVVIFGPQHNIEKLATALGTIPYEVLTNVSQRVKRVYLKD
jgi:alanine racemase